MKKKRDVYLFFLLFNAEDLRVYFDGGGVAAIASYSTLDFLQDEDVIRFCFSEGYITQDNGVGCILYAYTDNPIAARNFMLVRNMKKFVAKKKRYTNEEFKNLKRFSEAKMSMESLTYADGKELEVAMTEFESTKVYNYGVEEIAMTSFSQGDIPEFMCAKDVFYTQDDFLDDKTVKVLELLKFKQLMMLDETFAPTEMNIEVNQWNVFYSFFADTLLEGIEE